MTLPIVAFGNPILRSKCQNISADYPGLIDLLSNMWETMYQANGVGLAAPQINKSIRLFLIDTTPFKDDEEISNDQIVKKVFINPILIEESGEEWSFNEGCLSIPDIREDVIRNSTITISYFDENFKKHTDVFDGLVARVIQHEYDHINGVLFVDKISTLRKRMIKGKLKDITKGNVKVSYKMRF
tara:strand:- start:154 stop:708 length:555 start_codon:yes stop_codon:yes gene_type:complete